VGEVVVGGLLGEEKFEAIILQTLLSWEV